MPTLNHFYALLAFLLPAINMQAQDDILTNRVGTKIGTRSAFNAKCHKAWTDEPMFAIFDRDRFCECVLPIVLSTEAIATAKNVNVLENVDLGILIMSNDDSFDHLTTCTELNMNGIRLASLGEEGLTEMREQCAVQLREEPTIQNAGADPVKLCDCVFGAIVARDLTIGDVYTAMDPNSPLYNEVFMPCAIEAMPATSVYRPSPADISGPSETITVPVLTLSNVHKVKIRLGGADQYFIIDSGAEDCFISTKLATELEQSGAIDKSVILDDREYLLADGTRITCKRHVINGMQIGPLTADRVVAASMDQNIQYLLGKSFLQKFKRWHIDEAAKTLTLERH